MESFWVYQTKKTSYYQEIHHYYHDEPSGFSLERGD